MECSGKTLICGLPLILYENKQVENFVRIIQQNIVEDIPLNFSSHSSCHFSSHDILVENRTKIEEVIATL